MLASRLSTGCILPVFRAKHVLRFAATVRSLSAVRHAGSFCAAVCWRAAHHADRQFVAAEQKVAERLSWVAALKHVASEAMF